jgi:hypothetical protein
MRCRRRWRDSLDLRAERRGGVRHRAGTGDIDALVTLPVGTDCTFTVSGRCRRDDGALINTATVTPPLGVTDPVPGTTRRPTPIRWDRRRT